MELYTFTWDINALTVSFGNDLPTTPTYYLAAKNVLIYVIVKSFNSNIESCMQILFPALYRILYLFLKKTIKREEAAAAASSAFWQFNRKSLLGKFWMKTARILSSPSQTLLPEFHSSSGVAYYIYMYIYLTGRSRTSEGKINFKCK